jgi:U6 snRNA-associated Sm-like protein LSm1
MGDDAAAAAAAAAASAPAPTPAPAPAPAPMRPPPALANPPTLASLVRAIQGDWYEAVRLLQLQPALANERDPFGSYALHFAAMYRASPEVVTLLLRINPGAAKCPNKSKYLPIHYAAGNGAPPECVALIWQAYKGGETQRNGAGATPLELATKMNRAENAALLKDAERMSAWATELHGHTIGRANQLTYTVVNEINEMHTDKINSFLPGTSSLVEQLGAQVLVCLRDGKMLIGELQSFDQFGNLVLSRTVERVIVGSVYADKPMGTYILRGENIVLLGEVDAGRQPTEGLTEVSVADVEKAEKEHRAKHGLPANIFAFDD